MITYNVIVKKIIFLVCSVGFLNVTIADDFSDWTNEDLCRWVDSVSIPEPISQEIDLREVICYDKQESSQYALETPTYNEHGTVFRSPSSKDKKNVGGLRFIFNYKITL
jgi:hypothetical protein